MLLELRILNSVYINILELILVYIYLNQQFITQGMKAGHGNYLVATIH